MSIEYFKIIPFTIRIVLYSWYRFLFSENNRINKDSNCKNIETFNFDNIYVVRDRQYVLRTEVARIRTKPA